jgi:hypothetical protein
MHVCTCTKNVHCIWISLTVSWGGRPHELLVGNAGLMSFLFHLSATLLSIYCFVTLTFLLFYPRSLTVTHSLPHSLTHFSTHFSSHFTFSLTHSLTHALAMLAADRDVLHSQFTRNSLQVHSSLTHSLTHTHAQQTHNDSYRHSHSLTHSHSP